MYDSEDEVLKGQVGTLEPHGVIGFDGATIKGLIIHPDQKHVIYPLGNQVIIQDWATKAQQFLFGHTNIISAVDVSRSGKYIASGQINHIGFKAMVIIWDFEKRTRISKHELHKVRVEALTFSNNDQFLFSIGGRDCGSLVVWDVFQNRVICGATVAHGIQGEATAILTMNRRSICFITGGDNHMALWSVDTDARKVDSIDIIPGKLKRVILCMDVNERDELCFCGTSTGDVLKIRMNYHHDPEIVVPTKQPMIIGCFSRISKKKLPEGRVDLYSLGVRAIKILFTGLILIGAGDGTVELVEEVKGTTCKKKNPKVKMPSNPQLKIIKSTKVNSAVSSLQLMKKDTEMLVGTARSEIYFIDMATFDTQLVVTSKNCTIFNIAFPHNFSEVFACASTNNVRIWSVKTCQELLRIQVPNFTATCVLFSHDGKSIITGWNDGIIRSFTPLTGRLIYAILNVHNKGVSALVTNHEGNLIVSGGCEGQVRMWSISPHRQELICTLKEHKAPVSAIDINKAGTEAVSASTDGTCIVWDLVRQCRSHIMFGTTLFMCARFCPTDVQILTCGSDRKIAYWEVLDGTLVREVEGSKSGAINTLDISPEGATFVTGGSDQVVKFWDYQKGICTHIGQGHSGMVTASRFSPDGKHLVTTGAAGDIFIWKVPQVKKTETVEATPLDKEEKKETKGEVIQDLPSSRSDKSVKSDKVMKVCHCPCPKKTNLSNIDIHSRMGVVGIGNGDNVYQPEPKGSNKTSSRCKNESGRKN